MNARLLISKYFEVCAFACLLIINLFPLFSRSYFPYMDSPTHISNASLIQQMVFGHSQFLHSYYAFNKILVPNWIDHVIMVPLLNFVSPPVAEKAFLILYFSLFPLAVRYAVSAIDRSQRYLAYLAFPLSYHSLMMLSFYNFSMGLVFLIFGMGYFIRHFIKGEPHGKDYWMVMLFVLLCYFSHIMVIAVFLIFMAICQLVFLIGNYGMNIKRWFNRNTILLVLVCLPGVLFLGLYYSSMHLGKGNYGYLKTSDCLDYLLEGKLFIALGMTEAVKSDILALIFMAVFAVSLQQFVSSLSARTASISSIAAWCFMVVLLFMYFLLPDSDGIGGFVSMRICILIFATILVLGANFSLSKPLGIVFCVVALLVHRERLNYYNDDLIGRNKAVSMIQDQGALMQPRSFIVFFKKDEDWISLHYYDYLLVGMNREEVCFSNQEAGTGYFPLVWKDPNNLWRIKSDLEDFRNLSQIKSELKQRPVYYWVLGDLETKTDSASLKLKQNLNANCRLINQNQVASLYLLN